MEIKEDKYDFIIKMVLTTFIGSGLLYGVVLILSLAIKKPITLGESLSYFGAVLTAVVTIFGVMWQIEKNNEKIDEEKRNRNDNFKKHFLQILNKNLEKFGTDNSILSQKKIFEELLSLKIKNLEQDDLFFPAIKESIIEQHSYDILSFHEGYKILEFFTDLNDLNKYISRKFFNEKLGTIALEIEEKCLEIGEFEERERAYLRFICLDLIITANYLYKTNHQEYYVSSYFEEMMGIFNSFPIEDDLKRKFNELHQELKSIENEKIDIYGQKLFLTLNILVDSKNYLGDENFSRVIMELIERIGYEMENINRTKKMVLKFIDQFQIVKNLIQNN